MTTIGDLTTRCQQVAQDLDEAAWDRSLIRLQLGEEVTTLARQSLFGTLLWMQGVIGQGIYRLNEQVLHLATGTDSGSGTGNLTQLTDTTQNFSTLGVLVTDRLRNLADDSQGTITTVATTVITCAGGFTGGIENVVDGGDQYLIERPVTANTILGIETVLYNGTELLFATEDRLDRLRPGWEREGFAPRYWTVDATETPSQIRIVPPPLITGSSIPRFPALPLAMRWEDNFVVFAHEDPQPVIDEVTTVATLDSVHDALVWRTVHRLTSQEGEYQNLPVAVACRELARMFLGQIGMQ